MKEGAKTKSLLNWDLIDELAPFGGIRIEDDVVAKKDGALNFICLSLVSDAKLEAYLRPKAALLLFDGSY